MRGKEKERGREPMSDDVRLRVAIGERLRRGVAKRGETERGTGKESRKRMERRGQASGFEELRKKKSIGEARRDGERRRGEENQRELERDDEARRGERRPAEAITIGERRGVAKERIEDEGKGG